MIECPVCGSDTFQLEREEGHGDAGFAVFCSECDNSTAQVVARTLDARLQTPEDQSGLREWAQEGDR